MTHDFPSGTQKERKNGLETGASFQEACADADDASAEQKSGSSTARTE
eukprot:CAMPEP_0170217404 /NCGR_PEP_ID=MMETSP0116_2-20130129/8366_1 /TAXON_ID=400756 /ORGANISM="Durinskia baltica, Strain CSIRO CS-38" /LENGTH=47 /DNA_ID= /DNA_START= /DNA_END= /DNA_ORIENTATION=